MPLFRRVKNPVVFLLILLLVTPAFSWRRTWSVDKLLFDGILGVETIKGDPDRLLVWGKNYEKVEARVALVEWQNNKIKTIWESENFYARGSNLMCAVGNFSGSSQEVVVLTDNKWRLYKIEDDGLRESVSGTNITGIMEVTAGDIDGDGISELIITSVNKLLNNTVDKKIVVYKFQEGNFYKVKETEGFGNIRALATADLDGDGINEIIFEEGLAYKKGTITVLKDFEPIVSAGLRNYPVFALSGFDNTILVGDDSGSINLYRLEGSQLELVGKSVSVGWGLVDTAKGDFLQKGTNQIILISAPAGAYLLEDI